MHLEMDNTLSPQVLAIAYWITSSITGVPVAVSSKYALEVETM
jgi:hypothetical protein